MREGVEMGATALCPWNPFGGQPDTLAARHRQMEEALPPDSNYR
jgi:hypothetical protein